MWGSLYNNRGVYAQNKTYKLYKNGNFYNYLEDPLEKNSIDINSLKSEEKNIYNLLKISLDTVPDLPQINYNNWKERLKNISLNKKNN